MGLKVFGWLTMLALLWGPSFLFVKVAVQGILPVTLVAVRVSLAAMILYAILKIQRRRLLISASTWKHFAVMGLMFQYNSFPRLRSKKIETPGPWPKLHQIIDFLPVRRIIFLMCGKRLAGQTLANHIPGPF